MKYRLVLTTLLLMPFLLPFLLIGQGYWQTANLSQARYELAGCHVGDKVVFAGGFKTESFGQSNVIDIYDIATDTWTVDTMSNNREEMDVGVSGNKAVFVGYSGNSTIRLGVDVYDAETNTVESYDSPSGFPLHTATSGEELAYFTSWVSSESKYMLSTFNGINDEWVTTDVPDLGKYRIGGSSVYYEGKIYYAGVSLDGERQTHVTIYDTEAETWSTDNLSVGRSSLEVVAYDGNVYFIAGINSNYQETDVIDIYNIATDTWSVTTLPTPRFAHSALVFDNKIYVAGGVGQSFSPEHEIIEIYNPETMTWETPLTMQTSRDNFSTVAAGSQLYFAGTREQTTLVEIYNLGISSINDDIENIRVELSPNPAQDLLTIKLSEQLESVNLNIYNLAGQQLISKSGVQLESAESMAIDISELVDDTYLLEIKSDDKMSHLQFQKM